MKKTKKENNWNSVLITALIFIIIGATVYFIQSNQPQNINNNTTSPSINNEVKEIETEEKKEKENKIKEETEKTEETEYKEKEDFKNQEGDNIQISGDKIVSATGFAGASNYKFYLRNGNLYFRNISQSDEEEIIATGVKNLYLENKEVTAELSEEGKIIKENNYITYK